MGPEQMPEENISGGKKQRTQILAVDDMPDVLNMVKAILGVEYDVFALTKAEQVRKFLLSHTPDLFLLDIEMPEMDGYALLKQIRNMDKHRNTPVIFLTSNATKEYLKVAVDMGISDFIKKPFDKELLLERIGRCLSRNQIIAD